VAVVGAAGTQVLLSLPPTDLAILVGIPSAVMADFVSHLSGCDKRGLVGLLSLKIDKSQIV
jgi:hypothetical protein